MKLADVVNQFKRKGSEGSNFVRNPGAVLRRHGRRFFEGWYRDAEVGGDRQLPGQGQRKKKQKWTDRIPRPFTKKDSNQSASNAGPNAGSNGLSPQPSTTYVNGNGASHNGVSQNGYGAVDSYAGSSPALNGAGANGYGANDYGVNGNGANGYAANAYQNGHNNSQSNGHSNGALSPRVVGAAGAIATIPAVQNTRFKSLHVLPEGEILKGTWWGRYTIGECQRNSPRYRRYAGIQNNGNHPVWIHEYLLPEDDFNHKDAEARRNAFKDIIDLNLRLGNDRDFRVHKLQDVVASVERRCFLITQAVPLSTPLAEDLRRLGPMMPFQVRRALHQALQTLQYLHSSYRVRWPNNNIERGLYHGNLSLESLWVRRSEVLVGVEEPQFFIYFSNFALWEHLFGDPGEHRYRGEVAQSIAELGSISQDLAALGKVAFYLLQGGELNPRTGRPGDPRDPNDWPDELQHHPLQSFIYRLLGLGNQQPFNSAGNALTALHQLPLHRVEAPVTFAEEAPVERDGVSGYWIVLFALLGGLLGVLGLRPFLSWVGGGGAIASNQCTEPCRLQSVTDLPTGAISYGLETGGAWQTAFNKAQSWPKVVAASDVSESSGEKPASLASAPRFEATLEQRVAEAGNASLALDLETKSSDVSDLYAALASGEISFALTRVPASLPDTLSAEVVAYDGIVAVVPYSDATREGNIAQRLDGQISLATLREIYTGELTSLKGNQIKAYFPLLPQVNRTTGTVRFREKSGAIAPFTERLFTDELPLQSAFRDLKAKAMGSLERDIQRDIFEEGRPLRYDLFARMFRDFENALVETPKTVPTTIGFEQLSRVLGQCSVYPLAVSNGRGKAVQPLLQTGDRPVDVRTNLCDDKGSYWANVEAFQSGDYPLAYPLAVVYPKESAAGKAMADLLKTAEGQYLLNEAGLVPTMPIPTIRKVLWRAGDE
ncbi:MAG: hypothetical protein AAFP03_04280 [Cyanobacteria bacterium J06598_3]